MVEIVSNKWRHETKTGRIIISFRHDGIHIQEITELGDGTVRIHDENVISPEKLNDCAKGQFQL